MRVIRRLVLSSALWFGAGCSTDDCINRRPKCLGMATDGVVRVRVLGDALLRRDTMRAIVWLNARSPRTLLVLVDGEADIDVLISVLAVPEHRGEFAPDPDLVSCKRRAGTAFIAERLPAGSGRAQTIAHELGHGLDFKHTNNSADLMHCVQLCELADCTLEAL